PFMDVPRIVDRSFDCWEVEFNKLQLFDFEPIDNSGFDYDYPWLPDFLRCMEIIPLKVRK
ncbi:MAG: hypothetical protein PHD09_06730, partial [Candidatus Omnitrophica bacterium]|nr:hypothetical protein [Candidatus Omnitrophota bacterium]